MHHTILLESNNTIVLHLYCLTKLNCVSLKTIIIEYLFIRKKYAWSVSKAIPVDFRQNKELKQNKILKNDLDDIKVS